MLHHAVCFLSKLVSKTFIEHFSIERILPNILNEETSLSAHTNVYHFTNQVATEYAWLHSQSRPHGLFLDLQYPFCSCLRTLRVEYHSQSTIMRCEHNPCRCVVQTIPHPFATVDPCPFPTQTTHSSRSRSPIPLRPSTSHSPTTPTSTTRPRTSPSSSPCPSNPRRRSRIRSIPPTSSRISPAPPNPAHPRRRTTTRRSGCVGMTAGAPNGTLAPSVPNYTVFVLSEGTRMSGPLFFATKSRLWSFFLFFSIYIQWAKKPLQCFASLTCGPYILAGKFPKIM